jgi:hypothetical protein
MVSVSFNEAEPAQHFLVRLAVILDSLIRMIIAVDSNDGSLEDGVVDILDDLGLELRIVLMPAEVALISYPRAVCASSVVEALSASHSATTDKIERHTRRKIEAHVAALATHQSFHSR